ncbi:hypothetical protein MKK64_23700 [Methylobacterium sp. E-025]|uniref:hypothetical protein n=1 Tax=Methylobacterium sp. E-025 TaxID=2836561 RepID=UPI001FBA3EC7|nr:hypothetical protein [Methylobacterium sp. E-025]MCJ2114177.1 hypothetical protein [Methylobacterium sp. E-025]
MADLDALFDKTGAGFWKSRSDDELLEMEFTTDDPESLDNISNDPPPDEEAMVELAYNVAGRDAGRVRCVFCKYPNHERGVVMLYRTGQRRLVGRDCAHKHYGVTFDALVQDFDAAHDRVNYVERQRLAVSERIDLLGLLRAMRAAPAIREFAETRRRLRDFMGNTLWDRFVKIADRDEPLSGGHGTAVRHGEMTLYVGSRSEGYLQGAEMVRTGPTVAERLDQIELDLAGVIRVLRATEVGTRDIRAALVRMVDILKQVEAERVRMRSVTRFFDDENLGRIAHWMREHGRHGIAVEVLPYRLVDDYSQAECGPPKDYTIPGMAVVAAMRDAIVISPKKRRKAS